MKRYFALIAALLLVPAVQAATLTPYVSGATAAAEDVNANEAALNAETTANTAAVAANATAAATNATAAAANATGIATNTANVAANSTAIAGLAGGGDAVPITRVLNLDCAADTLQTSIDGAAVGKVQVNLPAGTCTQNLVINREVEIIGPVAAPPTAIISGHVTVGGHGRLRLVNMEVSSTGGADTGVTFVNSTVAVVSGGLELVDSTIAHTEDADMATFEMGMFASANATVSFMGGTVTSAAATETESSGVFLTAGTSLVFQSGTNTISATGTEEGIALDCITGGTVFAIGGTNTLTGGGLDPIGLILEGGCHGDLFAPMTITGDIEIFQGSSLFLSAATVSGRLQVSNNSTLDLDDEDGVVSIMGGCDPMDPFGCHRVDSNSSMQARTDAGGGLSITGPMSINSNSSVRLEGDTTFTGDIDVFQLSSLGIGAFNVGESTTVTGSIDISTLSSFQANAAYTVSGDVACFGTSQSFVRPVSVGTLSANGMLVDPAVDPMCHNIDMSAAP